VTWYGAGSHSQFSAAGHSTSDAAVSRAAPPASFSRDSCSRCGVTLTAGMLTCSPTFVVRAAPRARMS
jgi:hypothetical protein